MKRSAKIDNMRILLMFLVVLAHLYTQLPYKKMPSVNIQRTLIFAFHMPALAFISGICFHPSASNDRRVLHNFIYPYVVFQVLWFLANKYVFEKKIVLTFTTASWTLWYLPALALWYFVGNAVGNLSFRWKLTLVPASFAAAIVVGFDDSVGTYLTLSRAIVFLPFFLLGSLLHDNLDRVLALCKKPLVKVFALTIVAWFFLTYFLYLLKLDNFNTAWLYQYVSYANGGGTWGCRIITMLAAACMCFFLLVWVPDVRIPFVTALGMHTMPIYLLHTFVIRIMGKHHLFTKLQHRLVLIFVLAVVITAVLGSKPVVLVSKPLMRWPFSPKERKAEKKEAISAEKS